MRQLTAIIKRETGAFFHSSMAPVVMAGFLIGVGLFFILFLLNYSELSLTALKSARQGNYINLAEGLFRPLVSNMTLFLLLLAPALTMRLFAPEFSSGRYTLLASWPVSDHVWVVGKWASALGSLLLLILSSGAYFGVVWFLGKPEIGPLLAAFIGLFFLASCLTALGTLASVMVAHQMVAYFLAFALTMFLFIVGSLEKFLPGIAGQICREISFLSHFESFSHGLIDSRDILFFVLLTVVSLYGATAALAGRRLPAKRRIIHWMPAVAVLVVSVLLYIVGLSHPLISDTTGNKRYSLAPQTLQVLDSIEEGLKVRNTLVDSLGFNTIAADHVQVYAFYQRLDPARDVMDTLLKSCALRTDKFKYSILDPETELEKVKHYGVNVSRTVVVEIGDRFTTILQPQESGFISTVYRMIAMRQPILYFLGGHGQHRMDSDERPGYSSLNQILYEQGYLVKPLILAEAGEVPSDADVVVIAGPRVQPLVQDMEQLDAFMARGGGVVALFDPPTPSRWAEWSRKWGVWLSNTVIVEVDGQGSQFGMGIRTVAITNSYGNHEVTRSMQGVTTLFPMTQAVHSAANEDSLIEGGSILASSELSWAERDSNTMFSGNCTFDKDVDMLGPLAIGVANNILHPTEGPEQVISKMLILGNSEFLTNANVNLAGNRDLMLNMFSWMTGDDTLIQLRGRDPLSQPVVLDEQTKKILGWGSVLGWPLFVGSLSLGVMLRFRRKTGGAA